MQIAWAGDGAPVISGTKTGVKGRFYKLAPTALSAHCAAHAQSLASNELTNIKAFPLLGDAQHLLANLYTFFNASPKRMAFQQLYEVMGKDAKLKHLAAHAIRWLSMATVVERHLRIYVVTTLAIKDARADALSNNKAPGKLLSNIEEALLDPCILGVLCALSGALHLLWQLSKNLQKRHLSPEELMHSVHRTRQQVTPCQLVHTHLNHLLKAPL